MSLLVIPLWIGIIRSYKNRWTVINEYATHVCFEYKWFASQVAVDTKVVNDCKILMKISKKNDKNQRSPKTTASFSRISNISKSTQRNRYLAHSEELWHLGKETENVTLKLWYMKIAAHFWQMLAMKKDLKSNGASL